MRERPDADPLDSSLGDAADRLQIDAPGSLQQGARRRFIAQGDGLPHADDVEIIEQDNLRLRFERASELLEIVDFHLDANPRGRGLSRLPDGIRHAG